MTNSHSIGANTAYLLRLRMRAALAFLIACALMVCMAVFAHAAVAGEVDVKPQPTGDWVPMNPGSDAARGDQRVVVPAPSQAVSTVSGAWVPFEPGQLNSGESAVSTAAASVRTTASTTLETAHDEAGAETAHAIAVAAKSDLKAIASVSAVGASSTSASLQLPPFVMAKNGDTADRAPTLSKGVLAYEYRSPETDARDVAHAIAGTEEHGVAFAGARSQQANQPVLASTVRPAAAEPIASAHPPIIQAGGASVGSAAISGKLNTVVGRSTPVSPVAAAGIVAQHDAAATAGLIPTRRAQTIAQAVPPVHRSLDLKSATQDSPSASRAPAMATVAPVHSAAMNAPTLSASPFELEAINDATPSPAVLNIADAGGSRLHIGYVALGIDAASTSSGSIASAPAAMSGFEAAMAVAASDAQGQPAQGRWERRQTDQQETAADMVRSELGTSANSALQKYLSRYGKTRIDVGGGNKFHNYSFDMLVALRETKKTVWFTQLGYRRSNSLTDSYRTTANLGLGMRTYVDDYRWLLGANVFYDRDLTRQHQRIGVGLEAWTDYLKLSANGYLRLTNWRDSEDIVGYMERPANGFDIRAEGYLPKFPQLGMKLVYEKYFGNEVGLFGDSALQKNPSAVTVGLTYQPVPLIGFNVSYRRGQGGHSDGEVMAQLQYQMGVPLVDQLDPSRVGLTRQIRFNRLDLVDRNNQIVLEYRKKLGHITLPATVSGYPDSTVSFAVNAYSGVGFKSLAWEGSASTFAEAYSGAIGTLHLPAYTPGGTNTYDLRLVGLERDGTRVASNTMTVTVSETAFAVSASKSSALANGVDTVTFTASVSGTSGEGVSGQTVRWTIPSGVTLVAGTTTTDSSGKATATVTSTTASTVTVQALDASSSASANASTTFIADNSTAAVSALVASPSTISANGTSTSTLTATLKDAYGNAIGVGQTVSWQTTAGTLSAQSSTTDSSGQASVILTSATLAGTATVTSTAISGSRTASVIFAPDATTAQVTSLVASPVSITANGTSTSTLTATVKDANGNLMSAGVSVSWATSAGTLSASTSTTDSEGKATVVLTSSTTAQTATLTATAVAGSKTASVTFVADVTTAKVSTLTASPASITANGSAASTLTATLKDANGNALGAGLTVTWTTTAGTLAATTSTTGSNGQATVVLTSSTTAQTVTVGASAVAGSNTATVAFVADTTTATVSSLVASPSSITANGTATSTLTATLKDANGNALGAGLTVTWSTTSGTLSASSSTTDSGGQATVTLTSSTTAGTATVSAVAVAGSKTASVTFVADTSTATVSTLTASPTSITANGRTTSTLTATLKDANGNALGAGLSVTWSTTAGTLSATSSVTNSSGVATVTLTSVTKAQTATVTAQATAGSKTASVAFVGDVSQATIVSLTASATSATADGTSAVTFTATVEDEYGNLVSGATVSWNASLGTLSSTSTTTDSNGQSSVTLTSTTAGTASVNAATTGGTLGSGVTFVTADNYQLTETMTTWTYDDGAGIAATVTGTLTNNGVAVSGATVSYTISHSDGTASTSGTKTTDSSGTISISVLGGMVDASDKVTVALTAEGQTTSASATLLRYVNSH
ncbi:Ig-like domain-containing protein [Paraburkholderia tropica]|uniref:Ig-like domain-containing protein n=1 Tax=Paraburkholderia tropica TaxID=92647 RepID=UPI002AB6148C|nr:Ig-like domain-containing protein [Paraburkholderia tropica]